MAKNNQVQIQRAIEQMTDRPPVPEIDFTMHTLEDGAVVSTQERVIKDVRGLSCAFLDAKNLTMFLVSATGPSTSDASAD